MSDNDKVEALLKRIEQNQQAALALHREHLDLAKAQLERSNRSIQESLEIQRSAVARQSQYARFLLPVVGLLLLLLVYLLFRWDIL